jgi:hypothetical protein
MKAVLNETFGNDSCGGLHIYYGIFERVGVVFCTTVAQSSPFGRPSYNCSFAKFQKKSSLRSIIFRNFVNWQGVGSQLIEQLLKIII